MAAKAATNPPRSLSAASSGRAVRRLALGVSGAAAAALSIAIAAIALGGCSLGNVRQDDCANSEQCSEAFGLGSTCTNGYCTEPLECDTADDCTALFGNGTCIAGVCSGSCESTQKLSGLPCYACKPQTPQEFLNACTSSMCSPFDRSRLTKIGSDGTLPPLP